MSTSDSASLSAIQKVFEEALSDQRIRPFKGMGPERGDLKDKWRVFFTASCQCGIASLMYIEISKDKGMEKITKAAPNLLKSISLQVDRFFQMPCEQHAKMSMRPPI